jgi:hypothetical protein
VRAIIGGECTSEKALVGVEFESAVEGGEDMSPELAKSIEIRVADLVDVDPCTGRLSIDGQTTSLVLTEEHRSLMEKMVKRIVDELPGLPYKVEAAVDFAPDGLPRVVLHLRTL